MPLPQSLKAPVLGLIGLSTLLLGWQFITSYQLVLPIFVPSPQRTFAAARHGFINGTLLTELRVTILHMLQGWLLASLVAILLGSLIGISKAAQSFFQPTLEFLRPLPASATIPVAIALVGLSPAMVLGVITFGSMWPTLLATIHGFSAVDVRLREVARTLHMSKLAFIWKIGLPNAVPDIVAGMRLSLTVALILAVVCEMLTGEGGLGMTILMAARSFRSPNLYAGILLLGMIGLVSNHGLRLIELRILKWRN